MLVEAAGAELLQVDAVRPVGDLDAVADPNVDLVGLARVQEVREVEELLPAFLVLGHRDAQELTGLPVDVLLRLLQSALEALELASLDGDRAAERLQLLHFELQAAGILLELDGQCAFLLLALGDLSEQKVELLQDIVQLFLSGLSALRFLAELPQSLAVPQFALEPHMFFDDMGVAAEVLWRG